MEKLPEDTLEIGGAKNEAEKPRTKEGVNFVFEQNPELASVGTEEQYSQYLDSVFPTSSIRQIVYHGSPNDFDSFDKEKLGSNATITELSQKGFFFSDNIRVAQFYGKPSAYLVDMNNPAVVDDQNYGNVIGAATGDINTALSKIESPDGIVAKNFRDSVVEDEEAKRTGTFSIKQTQFVAFDSKQIHKLGTESDIENFKKFLANQKETTDLSAAT